MVHNQITLFRIERGLSRKDLAAAVGVNPQTIGFLERGTYSPSVELALKLAAVFGVPVDTLFSLNGFPSLATQIAGNANRQKEFEDD
jgi:DNA-binding XRE family transcriptional regulator